jgi:hypothetical protein
LEVPREADQALALPLFAVGVLLLLGIGEEVKEGRVWGDGVLLENLHVLFHET